MMHKNYHDRSTRKVVKAYPSTNSGVVDVIVSCNHAQVEWCYISLILYIDAARSLQVTQRTLHQLREVVGQVPVRDACVGSKA